MLVGRLYLLVVWTNDISLDEQHLLGRPIFMLVVHLASPFSRLSQVLLGLDNPYGQMRLVINHHHCRYKTSKDFQFIGTKIQGCLQSNYTSLIFYHIIGAVKMELDC